MRSERRPFFGVYPIKRGRPAQNYAADTRVGLQLAVERGMDKTVTTYRELDVVAIPEPVPELGIKAGTEGVVDHAYDGGRRADVEVSRSDGETVGFVTLDSRPEPRVVAHYVESD